MQRKATLYSLLLIFFIAASCGGDDHPQPKGGILSGSWAGQQQFEWTYTDGQLTYGDTTQLIAPDLLTLVFDKGTYSIHSDIEGETNSESGTYKADGSSVTFIDGDDKETYAYKVKGTTLTLEQSETETVNGKTVKELERIVFKKQ